MSVDDVIEPQGDLPTKDRREPGGGAMERQDDEALEQRTEQERVDAGLADYDPQSVPAATDEPVAADEE